MDKVDGPDQPTDDDLILAVARRDPAALMSLHDRYARLAFGLAYRILGEAGAAEETVQDAFMLVWNRATLFDPSPGRGQGKARSWLMTIVHHRAIDVYRRRSGRTGDSQPLDGLEDILSTPDIWGEIAEGLDRDRVRAAVATLPPDQREAIELAYFDGLTHREIADRGGTPLGTVKGRLRLGLRKLYGLLAEPEPRTAPGLPAHSAQAVVHPPRPTQPAYPPVPGAPGPAVRPS